MDINSLPSQNTKEYGSIDYNDIMPLYDYHPWEGGHNPNIDKITHTLLNIKNPDQKRYKSAVNFFTKVLTNSTKGLARFVDSNPNVFCIVPSHTQNQVSSGLLALAIQISPNFHLSNKDNLLRRTRTAQIALEADVNIGTLYDYFSSKEAVFVAYLDRELQRVLEAVATKASTASLTPYDMTKAYVRISVEFAYDQREMIKVMMTEFSAVIPELKFAKNTKELIRAIGLNFEGNEKIRPKRRDSDVMVFTVTNVFFGFFFRIVSMPNEKFDEELVVDELTTLIHHYIYKPEN
ncbi:MAG: TetR/AcrR family transcriptional regulator [Pseudomonadales bacterium]|nr:TetR/AcrR family transcriptional regulator [Pseudomonadales bacterium]